MEMRKHITGIMILVSQNMLYKFDKNTFIFITIYLHKNISGHQDYLVSKNTSLMT